MIDEDDEIVTIFYGEDVSEEEASAIEVISKITLIMSKLNFITENNRCIHILFQLNNSNEAVRLLKVVTAFYLMDNEPIFFVLYLIFHVK